MEPSKVSVIAVLIITGAAVLVFVYSYQSHGPLLLNDAHTVIKYDIDAVNLDTSECKHPNFYWDQYAKFKNMSLEQRHKDINLKKYDHKIQVTENSKAPQYVTIIIREMLRDKPSRGGSNFRVVVQGAHYRVCDVKDYFNGIYTAVCHLTMQCSKIKVTLMYIHFEAYHRKVDDPFREDLLARTYCYDDTQWQQIKRSDSSVNIQVAPQCAVSSRGEVTWVKTLNKRQLLINTCQVDVPSLNGTFNSCFTKIESLSFVGDSHLRFSYYYLLYKLGLLPRNLPRKLYADHRVGKYAFLHASYAENAAVKIEKAFKFAENKHGPHIIIANGGLWDLRDRGLQAYTQNFANVTSTLKKYIDKPEYSHVKVIWYSSVAFPDNIQHDARDNFVLSAMNWWVQCQLLPLGVEVFGVSFDATNIRNVDSVCRHHYLCKDNDTSMRIYGDVGAEILHALLMHICQTMTLP